MVTKTKNAKTMHETIIERAHAYMQHIAERKPLPPELRLSGMEELKTSLQDQIQQLAQVKEKTIININKKIEMLKSNLSKIENEIEIEQKKIKK